MNTSLAIIISSILLAVCLVCGTLLWIRRKEVADYSRYFLSAICFLGAACIIAYLVTAAKGPQVSRDPLLDPMLTFGGLYAISVFICYPIEVMRPRQVKGWTAVWLFLPSILVSLPLLFGLSFQELHSWQDFLAHWADVDVLLRLLCLVCLTVISLLLLFLPYNDRESSADYHWIRQVTFIAQVTSILFYLHAFLGLPLFFYLHYGWATFSLLFLTYFEIFVRLLPTEKPGRLLSESRPAGPDIRPDQLWNSISHFMDDLECWRNPNTNAETLSSAVGTNRIYATRCIQAHTGLSFNDYLNKKRIEYITKRLCEDPGLKQEALYFEAGYRSRQTAYRNFIKFAGCSPTEFLSNQSSDIRHVQPRPQPTAGMMRGRSSGSVS